MGAAGNTRKPGGFRGNCFKCDRTGHRSRECKYTTKLDGTPVKKRSEKSDANNVEPVENADDKEAGALDIIDISVWEVVDGDSTTLSDPWLQSDPWKVQGKVSKPTPQRFTDQQMAEFENWLDHKSYEYDTLQIFRTYKMLYSFF